MADTLVVDQPNHEDSNDSENPETAEAVRRTVASTSLKGGVDLTAGALPMPALWSTGDECFSARIRRRPVVK